MNILVVGSGGREHALAWKAAQSPLAEKVFVAPGNAGTELEENLVNIAIDVGDIPALIKFAQDSNIGLTIIGPEVPLVTGVVDQFSVAGLKCFGPSKAAAQLEGSKKFSKDFLAKHDIPTASYSSFTDPKLAEEYIRASKFPLVIKADGLAAGKGVIIASSAEEAITTSNDMLAGNAFGEAGNRVVIEEFLTGEEVSFICMVDGENILPMATSQDHKARDNDDLGPNTGGMGAYSPAPLVTPELDKKIMDQVITPTVTGMAADGAAFTGFLYAGLMISDDDNINVLEFNVRFGDPETQPIMMRLKSDLVELCLAAIEKQLDKKSAEWDDRAALGVVMAAGGYPEDYKKGDVISGIGAAEKGGAKVFHAGTKLVDNKTTTSGGRVLCVTALDNDIKSAQHQAYSAVEKITWSEAFYRTDIGYLAIDN